MRERAIAALDEALGRKCAESVAQAANRSVEEVRRLSGIGCWSSLRWSVGVAERSSEAAEVGSLLCVTKAGNECGGLGCCCGCFAAGEDVVHQRGVVGEDGCIAVDEQDKRMRCAEAQIALACRCPGEAEAADREVRTQGGEQRSLQLIAVPRIRRAQNDG